MPEQPVENVPTSAITNMDEFLSMTDEEFRAAFEAALSEADLCRSIDERNPMSTFPDRISFAAEVLREVAEHDGIDAQIAGQFKYSAADLEEVARDVDDAAAEREGQIQALARDLTRVSGEPLLPKVEWYLERARALYDAGWRKGADA